MEEGPYDPDALLGLRPGVRICIGAPLAVLGGATTLVFIGGAWIVSGAAAFFAAIGLAMVGTGISDLRAERRRQAELRRVDAEWPAIVESVTAAMQQGRTVTRALQAMEFSYTVRKEIEARLREERVGVPRLQDPVLGALVFEKEVRAMVGAVAFPGGELRLEVGADGRGEIAAALARAQQLATGVEALVQAAGPLAVAVPTEAPSRDRLYPRCLRVEPDGSAVLVWSTSWLFDAVCVRVDIRTDGTCSGAQRVVPGSGEPDASRFSPARLQEHAPRDEVIEWIRSCLERNVRSGYDEEADILESMYDQIVDELGEAEDAVVRQLTAEAQRLFAAQRAREATWTGLTANDQLDAAFAELRAAGIVALQDAGYTMSNGWDDVAEERMSMRGSWGAVFFHRQDVERGMEGQGLPLAFGAFDGEEATCQRVARLVCDVLRRHGHGTMWGGRTSERIQVTPFEWRKRRTTAAPRAG